MHNCPRAISAYGLTILVTILRAYPLLCFGHRWGFFPVLLCTYITHRGLVAAKAPMPLGMRVTDPWVLVAGLLGPASNHQTASGSIAFAVTAS